MNINFNKYNKNTEDSNNVLDMPNSRTKSLMSNISNYALDVNKFIDIQNILYNIDNFEYVQTNNGFTSTVQILEYDDIKIIKKIYKNRNIKKEHYVNKSVIKESFFNEIEALNILKDELHFPKILKVDYENFIIYMTFVGEILSIKKENINLNKVPQNWKFQMYSILETFKKYNLYHNDITERNICINNDFIYLIDFGNCKKHIDTYYRNFHKDLLFDSENIIDFLDKINKNSMEVRKCLHGFIQT